MTRKIIERSNLWTETLKDILETLLGNNEPSDEELDFDEDAIEMYAEMHNLKEAMEMCGLKKSI